MQKTAKGMSDMPSRVLHKLYNQAQTRSQQGKLKAD